MKTTVLAMGLLLAAFIAFGRALFGLLGSNTVWYTLGIALPYLLVSVWLSRRLAITARAGRRTTRGVIVSAALSWLCAAIFAVTVPDVQADGSLAAITAPPGSSPFALEMAIALCNPFAILQFVFLGAAIAISWHNAQPARIEVD
ncbi:hypothetical protein [Canibacter zhoujuaniae]|uniref:hypothetical protein n=1 Tax=Canibacter zhoujuaniae TaxID=2708343 RepID=UPI0014246D6B|nr:hypothetical protein [Canibacter zhoujuaniae]